MLVIAGAIDGTLTAILKIWAAFGLTPLLAVTVIAPVPPAVVGVPDKVVPDKVNQVGFPLTLNVGTGVPVAVMV